MGVKLTGITNVEGAVLIGEEVSGGGEIPNIPTILWDNGTNERSASYVYDVAVYEQLLVQDGDGAPLTEAPTFTLVSGNIPAGLTVSSEGLLSGIPSNTSEYTTVIFEVVSGQVSSFLTFNFEIYWVG